MKRIMQSVRKSMNIEIRVWSNVIIRSQIKIIVGLVRVTNRILQVEIR
jgi:hypothetical protein